MMDQTPGIGQFYDALAGDYDAMTSYASRFAREEPIFRDIIRRFGVTSALDAGCGTGFHSILLAELGVHVTGIDVSDEMIAKATENAQQRGLAPRFLRSEFSAISLSDIRPVDVVFCLGNALVHLLTEAELRSTITAFNGVLKPGGHLMVQILNYSPILAARQRILSVRESGDTTFVRFYDFGDQTITFNILTLRRSPTGPTHSLESIPLRPLGHADLTPVLTACGFDVPSLFGSMKLVEFDPAISTDLVIVARKSAS
jgi:SAM-dependent methyltransferase